MENLKEIFKQAAEIAQQVPQNMQEAAFQRAPDELIGTSTPASKKRGKGKTNRGKPREGGAVANDSSSEKKGGERYRRFGPKTAIEWLIENDFFTTAKTGPEVQEYLRKKRGYNLPLPQLRTAMVRLVRDGVMEREENAEGHYIYKTT